MARPFFGRLVPESDKRLCQCFFIFCRNTKNFTGRLHLWSKIDISSVNFFKREDRHFDGNSFLGGLQAVIIPKLRQFFPLNGGYRQRNDRDSRYFADIRHGTRRTRVCFNDIYFVVLDDKLDVHQPDHVELPAEIDGITDDFLLHCRSNRLRRIDGGTVSRMYTGTFHMLHDSGNNHAVSVTDRRPPPLRYP